MGGGLGATSLGCLQLNNILFKKLVVPFIVSLAVLGFLGLIFSIIFFEPDVAIGINGTIFLGTILLVFNIFVLLLGFVFFLISINYRSKQTITNYGVVYPIFSSIICLILSILVYNYDFGINKFSEMVLYVQITVLIFLVWLANQLLFLVFKLIKNTT